MKIISYRPNTFLSLSSEKSGFTLKSKEISTVISVNNINNLLVKLRFDVLKNIQRSVGFFYFKNNIIPINKNIRRFILVGWIDRP